MIIIGSTAIKHWFDDFPRSPNDLDVVLGEGEQLSVNTSKRVEILPNPVLTEYYKNYSQDYLEPDELYTLKMSHLFWDIKWERHEWDATWLRDKGCKLVYPLFSNLYEYFNTLHGENKRSDLKMSASDFFDNVLKCEYDHDWLHTLINPVPTFNKVLKDGAEVDVDESKFYALSEAEKEALVREEVYVMAYERWSSANFRVSYGRMLKKFILSHAPLWEAIWILENYKKLCRPEYNFIKHLNTQINSKNI